MSKLYPCVHCTEDGYCKKYSNEEVKSWCVQSPCEDERPSNADRIRCMSDEELAKTLSGEEIYPWCAEEEPCKYDSCTDCVLAWLKQEAEDG